jgi:hypothetical protein
MSGCGVQARGGGSHGNPLHGHGGCTGRQNNSNSNQQKISQKKTLQDHQYYLASVRQASDYEMTTTFLVNQIKNTFSHGNDIATALDQLKPFNFTSFKPSFQTSQSSEEDIKVLENEQFRIEFKTLFNVYVKQEQTYQANLSKSYAFLWDQCSKAMQHKIESHQDFDDDIMNNSIRLLQAIKEHALNYQDKKYPMLIIMDAFRAFATTKQKEGETLQDFTKRFKVAKDVLENHLGSPIFLTKFIAKMNGYVSESEKNYPELANTAFEQYAAYVYL